MQLLLDPQAWLSFLTLAVLEIVLGIDNIIFLAILVDRLPAAQRRRGRLAGLSFAMATRIALLFSVTWLASLRSTLLVLFHIPITARGLVLLAGGTFLVIQGIVEIREMLAGAVEERKPGPWNGFWLIILEIGVLDIAFSLDTVFTAVGLSNRLEVMVAAIVASVLVMMVVSAAVSTFIERHPTIKMLGLAFLILVGGALLAEGLNRDIPKGYLYFAMGFAAAVEALNLRVRRRVRPGG